MFYDNSILILTTKNGVDLQVKIAANCSIIVKAIHARTEEIVRIETMVSNARAWMASLVPCVNMTLMSA